MKYAAEILAQRYAQAFYNVYGAQLDAPDIVRIENVTGHVHTHRASLTLLMLPHCTESEKENMMDLLLQQLGDTVSIVRPLVHLLLTHQRIMLIGLVLQAIVVCYRRVHAIECFEVTTSHGIEEDELQTIRSFLEQKTRNAIEISYRIDQSLIAGIRMHSNAHIWEYSVRKQLQKLRVAHIG